MLKPRIQAFRLLSRQRSAAPVVLTLHPVATQHRNTVLFSDRGGRGACVLCFCAQLAHLWPEPRAMMETLPAYQLAHLWPGRQGDPVRIRPHGTVWDGAIRSDFFTLSYYERKYAAA